MKRYCVTSASVFVYLALAAVAISADESGMDAQFEELARRYVDDFTRFAPVSATSLGDHRYDDQLDEISEAARNERLRWTQEFIDKTNEIDPNALSRKNQVDLTLLRHALQSKLWRETELQEWAWNPLVYTRLTGSSIYGLMARDFAPVGQRLNNVAKRLEQFPRLLEQVRETIDIPRVPPVHATTAVAQNKGVLNILENMVRPRMDALSTAERDRLTAAMKSAEDAINVHQEWFENEVVPQAGGNFRIGRDFFDRKLAYTLHTPLTRQQIRDLADRRVEELHQQMYEIAQPIYQQEYPLTRFPENPSREYRRAIIRFGLEQAYAETPAADEIVETAEDSAEMATRFLKEQDLITVFPDPLEIIIMPEFQRGVSLAYCDSPGPLDKNEKTFYAVSPIPQKWSQKQVQSFLREYNTRSLHVLTIHEALPGHFLQLAHSNRYPGSFRHLFQSGPFVEGWAVYTEWMMCEEGFLDNDPLLQLITLKWYLRDVTNAILDQAIHVDGISRDEAMQIMVEDAFQEEREAAGKWTRAQLTSAQLSTYFVGYLEHVALRQEAERKWGEKFDLKTYHDTVLSFGSPPVQFARALLLDVDVPQN